MISRLLTTACLALCSCALSYGIIHADETLDFFEAEAKAISQAVDRVGAAVVSVEVIGVAESAEGEVDAGAPTAGTVVDSTGYILASSIVTDRPSASILVVLSDGTRLTAKVVARDTGRELVLLKVEPTSPLPAIEFHPIEDTHVGDYAIAVGRVRAEGPPARSVGIVSALSRLTGRALQTDARISPPFYGGPLVNIRGEVLGIIVPAMPDVGGTGDKSGWYDSGIAFAAPANQIATRLDRLRNGENITPGKLGVVIGGSDALADGTEITAVRIGSPAAQAGIETGDSVISVNGQAVKRHQQIKEILGPLDAGTQVELQLARKGETRQVRATLVADIPPFNPQYLGILPSSDGSENVRVDWVFPNSPASQAGIEIGDVIVSMDDKEINGLDELRQRIMTLPPAGTASLAVQRAEELKNISFTAASIANGWPVDSPDLNDALDQAAWEISELTLPDVPNKAAIVAPTEELNSQPVALLVVFAKPGEKDLSSKLEPWLPLAKAHRTIVTILSSQADERWTPDEADLGSRLVSMINKRYRIQPHAVTVTGDGPGGSMAIIAAFTDNTTFSGFSVASDVSPPAVQLRENDPATPIHVQIQAAGGDLPPWVDVLRRVGYSIVTTATGSENALRFAWMAGRI